ncbi:MAG: hypothetical protein ABGY75_08900, partial [Gemmataceae bacterium]
RHRIRTGKFPTAWGEWLTPPTDPFTALPLLLKPLADGLLIYSTGPDRTDDGGKLSSKQLTEPGYDLGLQLFAPAHRRQPPKPDPEK